MRLGNGATRRHLATGDVVLLALALVVLAAKIVRASGGPPGLLLGAGVLAAVVAIALAFAPEPRRRWLDPPRLVLVLIALASVAIVYPRLGGDGYQYYILLRSPLFDHDLAFANDFAGFGVEPATTLSGEITSRMPIGTALLWAPAVVLTHVGVLVGRTFGADVSADGFSVPYQAAATMTTFALVVGAVLMLEAALRRRFSRTIALLAVLGIWLATPLQFYATANPSMSHGPSAFAATVFVLAWLSARENGGARRWLLAGFAGGLVAIVRPQDAVLLVPAVLDRLMAGRRGWKDLPPLLVGPILLGAAQLAVWLAMYGWSFAGVVSAQSYVGTTPHVIDLLFSARHGLFTWTPIALVAVLGWMELARHDRRLGALFTLAFALAVLVNASMQDWWGSESFGQRRLLGLTPLFAFGLAYAIAFVERRPLPLAAAALAVAILWNDQLGYIYNTQMLGSKTQGVTLDRLAGAEADLLYRKAERWSGRLPRRVWFLLYDNLKGVWLDEGARSLEGTIDLGGRERDELSLVIGEGWRPPEEVEGVTLRRSKGPSSTLRVPIRTPAAFQGVLRARADIEEAVPVTVKMNGRALSEVLVPPGWDNLAFEVPEDALRPGFNELELAYARTGAGRPGKEPAVAVDWIRLVRRPSGFGPA